VQTGTINPIFTSTSQTGDFASNNTGAANFNENIGKLTFDIGFQLKDVSNNGDWGNTHTAKWETSNFDSNTFSVRQGTTNSYWGSYFDQYVKQNRYNLKFNETQVYIAGNSNKINADSLFECSWTYTSTYATDSDSGSGFSAPASNTGSGSRPMRGTKTTSTSPDGEQNFLELDGTQENPNIMQFVNTMQTGTLTVTKNFERRANDTSSYTFEFTVTFDNVGNLYLEEPNGVQGSNVITTTVSVSYGASDTGTKTATITGVPVGTEYSIVESDSHGYTLSYSPQNGTMASGGGSAVANNQPTPNPTPTPVPVVLKIQKVWGSGIDTKPTVSFLIQKNGTPISSATATAIDAGGNAVTITDGGMITLSSGSGTATATGGTNDSRDAWVVYVFDTNNTNASTITYSITEYYNGSAVTQTNNVYSFTVGTGDDAVTYQVSYTPGGLPSASANGGNCLSLPLSEFSGIANFSTTYVAYINNNDTVRVLPLSVLNTKPTQTDTPETGGRGGYVPIAGGFIAILLAGAGYFIYKKRIFA